MLQDCPDPASLLNGISIPDTFVGTEERLPYFCNIHNFLVSTVHYAGR